MSPAHIRLTNHGSTTSDTPRPVAVIESARGPAPLQFHDALTVKVGNSIQRRALQMDRSATCFGHAGWVVLLFCKVEHPGPPTGTPDRGESPRLIGNSTSDATDLSRLVGDTQTWLPPAAHSDWWRSASNRLGGVVLQPRGGHPVGPLRSSSDDLVQTSDSPRDRPLIDCSHSAWDDTSGTPAKCLSHASAEWLLALTEPVATRLGPMHDAGDRPRDDG